MSENISAQLKKTVAERAHCCCEYCLSQAKFAVQSFSIEHIAPRSKGGKTTSENLALACQGCNNHKYTKIDEEDPITGKNASLYHPRKEEWNDHFAWNEDFTLIIGITPTGRATVNALNLNREGLVNFRSVLHETGKHPPIN